MSEVQNAYHDCFVDIERAEKRADSDESIDQIKIINASLKGIFEMLAMVALQLEKINSTLKATSTD